MSQNKNSSDSKGPLTVGLLESMLHGPPLSVAMQQTTRDALLMVTLMLHVWWWIRSSTAEAKRSPTFNGMSSSAAPTVLTEVSSVNGPSRQSKRTGNESSIVESSVFHDIDVDIDVTRSGAVSSKGYDAEPTVVDRDFKEVSNDTGSTETDERRPEEDEREQDVTEPEKETDVDGVEAEASSRRQSITSTEDLEKDCTDWIQAVTGVDRGDFTFNEWLRDGQVLCQLANVIAPGSVPYINTSTEPFKQMENISLFLKACRTLDMIEKELFTTVDLFEGKNMHCVQTCIFHLAGHAASMTDYGGPILVTSPPVRSAIEFRTPPPTPIRTPPRSPE